MKLLNRIMLLTLLAYTILFLPSCKHTTEPPNKAKLTLELEDISCTEAWISLKLKDIPLPATVTLYKNNVAQNNILCYGDTLLYFDSLLPKQSYKFKAVLNKANAPQPTSNELNVVTMDTTSHNFTWQSWTFGTIGSSSLYDVAIIDENNIWAVGEIMIADTSINGYTTYNAVHWNGSEWKLKRIFFPTVCGSTSVTSYPAKAIFVFNDGQIWISSSGDKIAILQNDVQIDKFCLPTNVSMSINKLWGSSSRDLYAVGNGGNIAHWDGVKWRKIESGTTTNINDIWGITNSYSNIILYCPVSSFFEAGDKKILKIIDGKVDTVLWNRDDRVYSGWTMNENYLYVCGEGIFVNKFSTWSEINLQQVGTNSIRGNNLNDIFIAGDYGFKSHFNGLTWQVYDNNYLIGYSRLSFQSNIVAIAGNYQGKARVEIGRRN